MSARRRAPLLPPRAVLRDPVRRRAWLGGFNLLPYRRRDARRERRRRLLELAGAVGLGVAGVALACAMQGLERKRIDARRLVLEQQLVAWA
ncbi:pilus assembly protein PilN, partial [Burkholderia gladioli]|nr:pilus assembly protein PilN [Burkholderia gladioli]